MAYLFVKSKYSINNHVMFKDLGLNRVYKIMAIFKEK